MPHTTYSGYTAYQFLDGTSWGGEHWSISVLADGSRILRANCRLEDKSPVVTRDVIQSIGPDRQPTDALVRLTLDSKLEGATLFTFHNGIAECKGFNVERGHFTEQREINGPMRGFGTHALAADGWMTAHYDLSKGIGEQIFNGNLLTSVDFRGATGPYFCHTDHSRLGFHGTESVAVAAGTFDCHHFTISGASNDHPPYHLWATADGEFVFVKGLVEGLNWKFELMEYAAN